MADPARRGRRREVHRAADAARGGAGLGRPHPAQPGRGPRARPRSCGCRSRCSCSSPWPSLLPARARNVTATVVGVVLALVMIAKTLDMGFYFALNRSFDPVIDWTYAGSLVGLLRDSFSTTGRDRAALTLAAVLFVALLVLTPLATAPPGRARRAAPTGSLRAATALGAVWVVTAALGLGFAQPSLHTATSDGAAPFASASAAALRLHRGQPDPRRAAGPAGVRAGRGERPDARRTRRPAAHPAARQGRDLRVRRELRPLRGPGLVVLPRRRPGPRRRHPAPARRTGSTPAARS